MDDMWFKMGGSFWLHDACVLSFQRWRFLDAVLDRLTGVWMGSANREGVCGVVGMSITTILSDELGGYLYTLDITLR